MMANNTAFNGDMYIMNEFIKIIKLFNIKTIVETGTNIGNTTLALSNIVNDVVTIEKNEIYYSDAKIKLQKCNNVRMYLGSSPNVLNSILNYLVKPIMFYLDAHWYKYNPLIDELKTIHKMKIIPCIAIHDFKVPGRSDLGYDKFPDGSDYEFKNIKNYVDKIYGNEDNYNYYYNDKKAIGSMRGIIYITPNIKKVKMI